MPVKGVILSQLCVECGSGDNIAVVDKGNALIIVLSVHEDSRAVLSDIADAGDGSR